MIRHARGLLGKKNQRRKKWKEQELSREPLDYSAARTPVKGEEEGGRAGEGEPDCSAVEAVLTAHGASQAQAAD